MLLTLLPPIPSLLRVVSLSNQRLPKSYYVYIIRINALIKPYTHARILIYLFPTVTSEDSFNTALSKQKQFRIFFLCSNVIVLLSFYFPRNSFGELKIATRQISTCVPTKNNNFNLHHQKKI